MKWRPLRAWAAPWLVLACASAHALDLPLDTSLSGFATVGYSRSSQPYTYQRFIDNDGTFRRDSVAGLQLDTRLTSQVTATVQARLGPDSDHDDRYATTVSWAFLAYRPTNDLLIRVGKQRLPLYLYSESYDVGVTYDFAQLPTEVYTLLPSNDFTGASIKKTFNVSAVSTLDVEAYYGRARIDYRVWFRDATPFTQQGENYLKLGIRGGGLVVTYKTESLTLRLSGDSGVFDSVGVDTYGSAPFVQLAPGIGYFQTTPALPGPGLTKGRAVTSGVVAGIDWSITDDLRFVAEYVHTHSTGVANAPYANQAYASLQKRIGRWTPYVWFGIDRSPTSQLDYYDRINGASVPAFIPGANAINAAQRAGADTINVYDQHSIAIGASYALTAQSRIKLGLQRTHVGRVSKLVDAPAGGDVRNQDINVGTLSYSVAF